MEGVERAKARLSLLCAYFLLFSGYFALVNPPLEAPDEPDHLNYVSFVSRESVLPNQYVSGRNVPKEGHQHPLYYGLAAIVPAVTLIDRSIDYQPIPNPLSTHFGGSESAVRTRLGAAFEHDSDRLAFYALRLINCLAGAATVWVIGLLSLMLLREAWVWPPLLVATLPQFQFISGSVSNDALSTFGAALSLLLIVRAMNDQSVKKWLLAGTAVGLAILAKKSNLVLLPVLAVAPFFMHGKLAQWRQSLPALALALAIIAPLLVGNVIRYGELLGTQMEHETTSELLQPKSILSPYFLTDFPRGIAESFYANFGWMNVPGPAALWRLYWLAVLIPLAFSLKQAHVLGVRREWLAAVLVCLLTVAGVVYYNLSYTQYQGRLLFPMLGGLSLLWGIGMLRVSAMKIMRTGVPLVLVAMNLACVLAHWRFYN